MAFDMKKEKFLTVMAVFDDATQKRLSKLQNDLICNVSKGTQTMGIPFHITLGSYQPMREREVVEMIRETAAIIKSFPIELIGYRDFGNRVLFAEPTCPGELLHLRDLFASDYAENFPWVPHATLFCGTEDEVTAANTYLPPIDEPIKAAIVGIELGEFFPPRRILRIDFEKEEL